MNINNSNVANYNTINVNTTNEGDIKINKDNNEDNEDNKGKISYFISVLYHLFFCAKSELN